MCTSVGLTISMAKPEDVPLGCSRAILICSWSGDAPEVSFKYQDIWSHELGNADDLFQRMCWTAAGSSARLVASRP